MLIIRRERGIIERYSLRYKCGYGEIVLDYYFTLRTAKRHMRKIADFLNWNFCGDFISQIPINGNRGWIQCQSAKGVSKHLPRASLWRNTVGILIVGTYGLEYTSCVMYMAMRWRNIDAYRRSKIHTAGKTIVFRRPHELYCARVKVPCPHTKQYQTKLTEVVMVVLLGLPLLLDSKTHIAHSLRRFKCLAIQSAHLRAFWLVLLHH